MDRKRFSISVDDDLYEQIYAAGLFERRSVSSISEKILDIGIREYRRQVQQFYGVNLTGAGAPAGAGEK